MARNKNVSGIPQDGDVYEENDEDRQELDIDQPEDDDDDKPVARVVTDPRDEALAAMRAQIDGLQASIASLRAPAPTPKTPDPEPEPDWEDLMFKDPKEYHKRLRQSIEKDIKADLTDTYTRDQSTKDFWNAFYADHSDLKGDDDLVRTILQANLAELAPMPVKAAGDKLAELTRSRILKYTGGKIPSGKKAVAEGNGHATPKPVAVEENKVVTLSSLLRARRLKRNKGTAA